MPRQQFGQKALVNRHFAASERGDFFLVIIDEDNLVPEIGETNSSHQANISGTNYCDAHIEPALLELLARIIYRIFVGTSGSSVCNSYFSSVFAAGRQSNVIVARLCPGMGI
jgi:hypothetical protein